MARFPRSLVAVSVAALLHTSMVAAGTLGPLSWVAKAPVVDVNGAGVEGAAAGLIGSKIYVSHGYSFSDTAALRIYDIGTDSWTIGPPASVPRSELGGAVVDGKLYAIGGRAAGPLNVVEIFDPVAGIWSTGPSMPTARAGLGLAVLDGLIHAIGGRDGDVPHSGNPLAAHEVFDPVGGTWTSMAPLPTPVMDVYATAAVGSKIYVFGGFDGKNVVNLTQIYDPTTDSWSSGAPMPTARSNAIAGVINGHVIVIGGLPTFFTGTNTNVVEIYDPGSNSWTEGPPKPTATSEMASAAPATVNEIFAIGSGAFGVSGREHEALVMCSVDADCGPGTSCTAAQCDPQRGCVSTPINEGQPCAVNSVCVVNPTCQSGACVGSPLNCDDHNPCTADFCDAVSGCVHNDLDFSPCDDGNACTLVDYCLGGVCRGFDLRNCADLDNCTADSCDPTSGQCLHVPTPKSLGGDAGGCIPPDKQTAKCEDGFVKAIDKLGVSLGRCHVKALAAEFRGKKPFDEERCEAVAGAVFNLTALELNGCPACLLSPSAVPGGAEAAVEQTTGRIACAPGQRFGDGDDEGFVPPTVAAAACELKVSENVLKLAHAVFKCHIALADAAFADQPFDEAACETAAKMKFDAANAKLKLCPPCIDFAGLRDEVLMIDTVNPLFYCASPSGAFLN